MTAVAFLIVVFGTLILISLHKLHRKVRRIMVTEAESIQRFDALTARSEKILAEVETVKQALADLRAKLGTLTPGQEAALVRAEEALGRVDEANEDAPAPEPTPTEG